MGACFPAVIEIPGYYLKRTIGSGGMATVYLAVQESLQREVALKVMTPALSADETFAARFRREARTIAQLSHPNIVQIFDVGTTKDNHNYFSMQYLPGGTLKDRIGRRLDEMEIFRIFTGVLRALGFAHDLGFVHRDVKPENVLFDVTGTPVLSDFGIARAVRSSTRITETGMSVGTSKYMSPEQARGATVDARSDLYSVGVVLYETLTGAPPFDAEDTFAVAYAHVNEPVPNLPPQLRVWQPVLGRVMAKDPRERFPSADAFIKALEKIARQGATDRTGITRIFTGGRKKDGRRRWRLFGGEDRTDPTQQVQIPLAIPSAFSRRLLARLRPWLPSVLRRPVWRLVQLLDEAATGIARRLKSVRRHGRQHPATYIGGGLVLLMLAAAVTWLSVGPEKPNRTADDAPGQAAVARSPDGGDGAIGPSAEQASARVGTADTPPDTPPETPVMPSRDRTTGGELEKFLHNAEQALADNRLTTPEDDNALTYLERVLAREPGNERALDGIRRIVERYLVLSDEALSEGVPRRAAVFLLRAKQVRESHEVNGGLSDRLRSAMVATYEALWSAGERALMEDERERAREYWLQASRLLPEEPASREALARLERKPPDGNFHDPLTTQGRGPEMVPIPTGSFMMGNASTGQVEVTVNEPFAMSRHEITVAQFRQFVEHSGYEADAHGCEVYENRWQYYEQFNWSAPGFPQNPDHPVVCVSWNDAQAYVAWLSVQTGKSYRLPTEAEWEYALVTGTDMSQSVCELGNVGDLWLKGRYPREEAFDCADGAYFTTSVGSWPPDGHGLYDMLGNAREWVLDCWNRSHSGRNGTQSARLSGDCTSRVIKGSSWLTGEPGIEPAHRVRAAVDSAYNAVGFRVVRELDGD